MKKYLSMTSPSPGRSGTPKESKIFRPEQFKDDILFQIFVISNLG